MLTDEPTGERGADDGGEGLRQVEEREDLAAVLRRDPEAQEEDRTREEAGFGHTQDETQDGELLEVRDPREEDRDDAPGHHDARQPATSAELVERQVAGDFEQDVADEEDPGREPELGGRHGGAGQLPALHGACGGLLARHRPPAVVAEHEQKMTLVREQLRIKGFRAALKVGNRGALHTQNASQS